MSTRENTGKYITFFVPIEEKNPGKVIIYKIKIIDSKKFMFSSLLGLVDELAEGLYKEKCKNSKSNLEDVTVSDGSLILKYQD